MGLKNRKMFLILFLCSLLLCRSIVEKEPNNCFNTAFAIYLDSIVRGQLDEEDCADYFLLKIPQGGVYDFTVQAEGNEAIGIVIFSQKKLLKNDPLYQIIKDEEECICDRIPVAAGEGRGKAAAAGVELQAGNYYIKISALPPFKKTNLKLPLLLKLLFAYEPERKTIYTLKISSGAKSRNYLFLLEEVWQWIEQMEQGVISKDKIDFLKSRYSDVLKGEITESRIAGSLLKLGQGKASSFSVVIKALIEAKGKILKSIAASPDVISHVRETMSFSHKLTEKEKSHLSKLWKQQEIETYPLNLIITYNSESFIYTGKKLMKALFLCVYDANGILSLAVDDSCPFRAEELTFWSELKDTKGFFWRKPSFNKKIGCWTSVIADGVYDPVYKKKIGTIIAEVIIGR